MRSNNYLYYSIYIYLETSFSFVAAKTFISQVEILSENLFESIEIQVGVSNFDQVSKFIEFYETKGLPYKCLKVRNKDPRKLELHINNKLIDNYILNYLTKQIYKGHPNWKLCKRCHTFEIYCDYELDSSIEWTNIEHKVLSISNKNVEQIAQDIAGMNKSTAETLIVTNRGNMSRFSRYIVF